VERKDFLAALQQDGVTLADAAERAFDRPVPSCPGWVGRDVVAHTGEVHRRMGDRVRRGATRRDDVLHPDVPDGEAVLPWYREGLAELIQILAAADPATPVWNWSSVAPHTAAFWPRRMAQETAVHRVDAQLAGGAPEPVEAALAADGVDEFLTVFFAEDAHRFAGDGRSVSLRTIDVPAEWTVTAGEAGATIASGPATDAAATLQGDASNLLLVLWRRLPLDMVDVSGDRPFADRFLAAADLD
jgi:uncharacterized protein (TIGR03083 family)